ncbi:MAG TPA: hypothetical protein VG755_09855 [Nannocystaceae bacterium]|nr:hypothetical protein [Nannocystaceae bacterium]
MDAPPEPPPRPRGPFDFRVSASGIVHADDLGLLPATNATAVVEVLDPGAEPRRELRYSMKKGDRGGLAMTMDMTMTLRLANQPPRTTLLPRMVMLFDVAITESENADVYFTSTVREARAEPRDGVDAKVAAALSPKLARMAGMVTKCWMDPRGNVRDATAELPPGAPAELEATLDQVRQAIEGSSVPLPIEAVGSGAKWRVLKRLVAGGLDIVQVASYRLDELHDDEIVLDAVVTQVAAAETAQPKGIPVRVLHFGSTGGGRSRIELNRPVIPNAEAQSDTATEMQVFTAGVEVNTAVDVQLRMQVSPVELPATKPKRKRK